MAKSRRMFCAVSLAVALSAVQTLVAVQRGGGQSRIRLHNSRVAHVFQYAMKKSPAFEDLVTRLEKQDRVVYVQEGRCHKSHSCLLLLSPRGSYLQIRVDPRGSIKSMVARLAHELYHASEIARDPAVVDAASLQALFGRIGYQNKSCLAPVSCWETRAAVAFEALVTKELNGG